MKLVLVEWTDSVFGTAGWTRLEDVHIHPHRCISVGLLFEETEEQITLLGATGEGEVGNLMAIPKVCITRVRQLKVHNNERRE